jgi:hypothetical protein
MRRLRNAVLAGILLLTACNDTRKPNDANFRNAINQYLQTHGQACTWIGQLFPVDVSESQQKSNFGIAPKMAVLEQAGFVQPIDTMATVPEILSGNTGRRVKRYEPTVTGKQYLRQNQAPLIQTAGFCYGAKTVDSIVKWTEPTAMGPATVTEVTYTYRISDLAPWAQRPDIQKQFGDIRQTIDGISKTNELAEIQLTNKGWEIPAH